MGGSGSGAVRENRTGVGTMSELPPLPQYMELPPLPQHVMDRHWREAGIIATLILMRRYEDAKHRAQRFLRNDHTFLDKIVNALDDANREHYANMRKARPRRMGR